jgi:ABC-type branched-subunit amino acid transport system substrate-binding protein
VKFKCKMAVAFLLILVMLVPLSLSCGGGGGGGKATIHIGFLTDLTGEASPALKTITFIVQDMIRHYNDDNVIPGVRLKLDTYDTQFDASRYPLGYEWCRQKGANMIITVIGDAALASEPFAARDKIPLATISGVDEDFTPPGWTFGFSDTNQAAAKILLHWVSENDWPNKGQGTPKIALIGWDDTVSTLDADGLDRYLHAHPNEYDYVDRITTPVGTMTFTSEALKLKNEGLDYVGVCSGTMWASFVRDLRAAGSQATVLDCLASIGAYTKLYSQQLGWDLLQGQYSTANNLQWNETSSPIVQLATTLVNRYHSGGEAQDIIASGNSYVGVAFMVTGILEVLQQAIQNVGAKNFNGQAYYDAALNYKTTSSMWAGCPEFGFSETRRTLMDKSVITEYKGENYVRISDWLPNVD